MREAPGHFGYFGHGLEPRPAEALLEQEHIRSLRRDKSRQLCDLTAPRVWVRVKVERDDAQLTLRNFHPLRSLAVRPQPDTTRRPQSNLYLEAGRVKDVYFSTLWHKRGKKKKDPDVLSEISGNRA